MKRRKKLKAAPKGKTPAAFLLQRKRQRGIPVARRHSATDSAGANPAALIAKMTPEPAFLQLPSLAYKDSYIDAVYEYIGENQEPTWHPEILQERFGEFLLALRQAETEPLAGMAPATQYWLVANNAGYLGEVSLRHCLNESLKLFGGHLGYKIRPSQRRKGYGSLLCKLAIEKARQRGIADILITCDDDNTGSWKIIEANGGVLVDRVDNKRGALTRRYWVYLDK